MFYLLGSISVPPPYAKHDEVVIAFVYKYRKDDAALWFVLLNVQLKMTIFIRNTLFYFDKFLKYYFNF